ncbi:MAG: hypothetical protein ACRD16_06950 [Thermoanaerobaculia bacterium]
MTRAPGPLARSLLRRPDIRRRIFLERLTEPLHLNLLSALVAVLGTYRMKIAFDLVLRQEYANGLMRAAELARAGGFSRVTVVELGVGAGTGLLNLCSIAERLSPATGIGFDIVGFDSGRGLPEPADYRDHPECWGTGWFPMQPRQLLEALAGRAALVLGDFAETVPPFADRIDPRAPLGFAILDVDYYTSAKSALALFAGPASSYLPYLPVYVDDIKLPSHNSKAGEALAIAEFNQAQTFRALEFDRFLVHSRIFKHAKWLSHMFNLHVLDHPRRNDLSGRGFVRDPGNPYLHMPGKGEDP